MKLGFLVKDERLREKILYGNLWSSLIFLAVPIVMGNFLSTLYSAVDLYFLGKIGLDPISAMGLLNNFLLAFLSLGVGLGVGVVSIIGQEIGAGNFPEVRRVSAQVILLSQILGITMGLVLWVLAPAIMSVAGAIGEVHRLGVEYLRITSYGLPFIFLTFTYNALNNAEGRTWVPFLFSFAVVALNFFLNPFFIFTLEWGMAGAAWATVLVQSFQAMVIIYLFATKKGKKRFHFSDFTFHQETLGKLFEKSLIPSLNQGINSLGFAIYFITINNFGEIYLVSVSISNRIFAVMYMSVIGISGALVAIIAQNVGARQYKRVGLVFRCGNLLIIIVSTAIAALIAIKAELFLRIFVQDDEVISFSKTYLYWFLPVMPLLGTFDALMSLFLGYGFMRRMMAFNLMRIFLLRVPSAYFLSRVLGYGEDAIYKGVAYATIIAWSIAYLYYFLWFKPASESIFSDTYLKTYHSS